jgi:uncharacterized protein YegL
MMEHRRSIVRPGAAPGPTLALALTAVLALAAAPAVRGQTGGAGVTQDNVVVLLDASGSMKEMMPGSGSTKMIVARQALERVLAEVPDTTNVGILVFGGRVSDHWIYPLGPIDRNGLRSAIRRPQPSGGTPLGRFLKIAADRLLEQRAAQHGYGTYRLLVVTDGEAGDAPLVNAYTPDIMARGITVDVVGVDMADDHTLATRVHSYRRADDPDALVRAVTAVFAEVGRAGDDDTSDEQFALLAAIPDDAALPIIEALTRAGNHPIGTSPGRPPGARGAAPTGAPTSPPGVATPPGGGPVPGSRGIPFGTIVFVVVVVAVLLKVLVKVARSGATR